MTFINFFKLGNGSKRRKVIREISCLFIVSIFLFSSLFVNINNNQTDFSNHGSSLGCEPIGEVDKAPQLSGGLDYLQDPYTVNFSDMWTFFSQNLRSSYDYGIDLYVNESDNTGTILHNVTYSGDNLLLYKSLINNKLIIQADENLYYNESETFETYLDLKLTPFWYSGNYSQFEYGFVKSINSTNEEVIDDKRYLIDNLMPIFLLLENIGDKINDNFNGKYPRDSVTEIFKLINSSQFWDSTNYGFYETNSSTAGDKYVESNLYAVLANFMIYKSAIVDATITDRAYEIAKLTMENLVNNTWDSFFGGFYHSADQYWTASTVAQKSKHLSTNALGIIALLEYWKMTGMRNNSKYYQNATALYERLSTDWDGIGGGIDGGLWNSTYNAYEYNMRDRWDYDADISSRRIDLESNALMMMACLKLFEVSGNISYYNRAIELFESMKKYFYNTAIDAHKTSHGSIGSLNNPDVSFRSNLKLCEAYLKAFEIYNSTVLTAQYNITGKTDYIMNQDLINLTCTYYFEKDITYYDPSSQQFGVNITKYDNFTGATVELTFKYQNETSYYTKSEDTINSSVNLIYSIDDSLPFGDGYIIDISANISYFRFQHRSKVFNVISGLQIISSTLKQYYYQGETTNFSIEVQSNYNFNLTLNITLYGDGIKDNTSLNIDFENNSITIVELNITVLNDATTGKVDLYFKFENGTTLYSKESIEIEIRYALSYSNLIYSNEVVPGDVVRVFIELINFLPNESQELNLTFSSSSLISGGPPADKITLTENQRITKYYELFTTIDIKVNSITIDMSISKGNAVYHSEQLTVKIVHSLEIISIEFPEEVPHWVSPTLILYIQNNHRYEIEFDLFINEEKFEIDKEVLIPGENRIELNLPLSWNPYDIGRKTCKIEIEDDSDDVIVKDSFEYKLKITAIDLIFFYIMPIAFPVGIILYYKNKLIKHKLLKR